MKYLLLITGLVLFSCQHKVYYRLKTTYVYNHRSDKTHAVDLNTRIAAVNDSVALVRAAIMFNRLAADNEHTNIELTHFDVYDRKGNIVRQKQGVVSASLIKPLYLQPVKP